MKTLQHFVALTTIVIWLCDRDKRHFNYFGTSGFKEMSQ
jgi:hypothetical protein